MGRYIFLFGKLRKVVEVNGEEGVWFTFRGGKRVFKPLRVLLKLRVSQPAEPSPSLVRRWESIVRAAGLPGAVRMLKRNYPASVWEEVRGALKAWLKGNEPQHLERYIKGERGNVLTQGLLSELQALSQAVHRLEGRSISVYRGLSIDQAIQLRRARSVEITRSLSSFSESREVARHFAGPTGLIVSGVVPVSKMRFSWRVLKELFHGDYRRMILKERELVLRQLRLPLSSLQYPRRIPLGTATFGQQSFHFVRNLRSLDDYFSTITKEYSSWGQLVDDCDYVCVWGFKESGMAVLSIVPKRSWKRFVEDYASLLYPDLVEFGRRAPRVDLTQNRCLYYVYLKDAFVPPPSEPFFKVARRYRLRGGTIGRFEVRVLKYFKD